MSKLFSGENKKNILKCCLLKYLPSTISIKLTGHSKQKNDRKISQPRQVSSLNHKDILVALVTCSDAATVVLTDGGDIYVLHEYQCRKIASK